MAAVLVLNTPDDGRLTPETCRVTLQKYNQYSVASSWWFIWQKYTLKIWRNVRRRFLLKNYLLKHFIEVKIEETGRRGRRSKQLKETRRYSDLTEEALDPTVQRTRSGRVYGPVVKMDL